MADTQTMVETERRQTPGVDPHESVEVFDTDDAPTNHQPERMKGGYSSTPTREVASEDAGFGHADLRQAEVIRGDADAAEFRSTDLRNSELNTADFTPTQRAALDNNSQGTNWSTILMAIALILVIILIGFWFF